MAVRVVSRAQSDVNSVSAVVGGAGRLRVKLHSDAAVSAQRPSGSSVQRPSGSSVQRPSGSSVQRPSGSSVQR